MTYLTNDRDLVSSTGGRIKQGESSGGEWLVWLVASFFRMDLVHCHIFYCNEGIRFVGSGREVSYLVGDAIVSGQRG